MIRCSGAAVITITGIVYGTRDTVVASHTKSARYHGTAACSRVAGVLGTSRIVGGRTHNDATGVDNTLVVEAQKRTVTVVAILQGRTLSGCGALTARGYFGSRTDSAGTHIGVRAAVTVIAGGRVGREHTTGGSYTRIVGTLITVIADHGGSCAAVRQTAGGQYVVAMIIGRTRVRIVTVHRLGLQSHLTNKLGFAE